MSLKQNVNTHKSRVAKTSAELLSSVPACTFFSVPLKNVIIYLECVCLNTHRTSLCFYLITSSLASIPFLSPAEIPKPAIPSPAWGLVFAEHKLIRLEPSTTFTACSSLIFKMSRERVYMGLLGDNILEDGQLESQRDQVQILPAKEWRVGSLLNREQCHQPGKNTNTY